MNETCKWCGQIHRYKCPMVKAIEYQDDGITIRRVEFMVPGDYAAPIWSGAMPLPGVPWPTVTIGPNISNVGSAG